MNILKDKLVKFMHKRLIGFLPGPSRVDAGPAPGPERVSSVDHLLALDREVPQPVQLGSINVARQT